MKRCNSKFLRFALAITLSAALLAGCGAKDGTQTEPPVSTSQTEPPVNTSQTEPPASGSTAGDAAFSYSDGIDENGFLIGVRALDYVEIFDYKALRIPSSVHQVTDDSLQAEINNLLSSYASGAQITDRAVVDGDTLNIDYVGSVDGVEFSGGSTQGMGTDVTIGVTSYIDDFLEQLIGHMPGETINVEVTFPDAYQEASLQGKDAVFVTTINYITDTALPELTDSFVYSNFSASNGWDTVAVMKEEINTELKNKTVRKFIGDYAANEVTIRSTPESLAEYQLNSLLKYYRDGADYYDMELEDFVYAYEGISDINELIKAYSDYNQQISNYTLVLLAVAEDAGITVSEEDMIEYFDDYSQYVEEFGIPYLKQIVLLNKVVDYIAGSAVYE